MNIPDQVTTDDLIGHCATTVPSAVKVLDFAWRHHGSGRLSWARLLQSAIRCAQHGYQVGPYQHRVLARYADKLREDPILAKVFLRDDGSVPQVRSRIRQPKLAETLRRLAESGADDFYTGSIAREIVEDMQANGGWITERDLATVQEPVVSPPLHGDYRGWDVYTLPPPFGGWVVLQMLEILEKAPQEDLAPRSPNRLIWLAEAIRCGHRSRLKSPIVELTDYDDAVASRLSPQSITRIGETFDRPVGGETTHFSIVDREGMVVAVTASINAYFGAGVAHPDLGFLYNSYMQDFVLDHPDHPYAYAPRSMAYSSMSATILARNGKARLALGSPGSKRIISTVVQLITHWVDGERDIAEAIAAPRIHVIPERDLFVEADQLSSAQLVRLEHRGFRVVRLLSSLSQEPLNPYFGGVHAVAKEGSWWKGVADPRRDGVAETQR